MIPSISVELLLPTISIVTPSFNQGKYLEKCINSILSQNYPNLEYIIMDGGSSDGSVEIIKKYEMYLTYWQSQPDKGHYSAVNEGFNRASGDILCWLNSDDMFHPDGLFKVASVFNSNQEIEFVTGRRVGFDAEGKQLSYGYERYCWCRDRLLDPANIDRSLFVMQEATFWRRSLWERAGGYLDNSFDLAADFELWCRFSRYTRLHTVDALLAGYRYYGIEQRSQQHRDDYVNQCKAIIERERGIASEIPEHDNLPPAPVVVDFSGYFLLILAKKPLPTISIITPSFNQAHFLEECIDSVLSQNYPNPEFIIMDGGSTDGSVEIIKKYKKYLTYWQSKPDGGQYNAVNEGFKRASGDIMAWLNSDDKYQENAFFKVAYLLSSYPHIDWLTARHAFWDGEGKTKYLETDWLPEHSRGQYLRKKYDKPYIQQESTFWRRTLWAKAGGYLRSDLEFAGDLELWTRFFRHAQLYTVDTLLGGYRIHGEQKVGLHLDLYRAEAEKVLEEEQTILLEDEFFNSPAPKSLAFDVGDFLSFMKAVATAGPLSGNSEQVIDYLLHRIIASNAAQEKQPAEIQSSQIEEIYSSQLEAIYSSLSWRLTKPLRWLGDRFRELL